MNNLIRMNRYQIIRNKIYILGMIGFFLLGFFFADTYLSEIMVHGGGPAASLADILEGMVYDTTLLLVIMCSLLSLLLGQEFSHRTIDHEICAGHPRASVFAGKAATYLTAFNLMALIYPLGGCIREFNRFGIGDVGDFLYRACKVILNSVVMNSAFFMIPIFFCFCFRRAEAALTVSALVTFLSCLYLAYGMMLGFPVRFLPTFQIREGLGAVSLLRLEGIIVAILWLGILLTASWRIFQKSELK